MATRSRKDFSKPVLAAPHGQPPLEPTSCVPRLASAALRLLPRVAVDAFGRPEPPAGGSQKKDEEPQRFRAMSKCAILKVPGAVTAAAAQINAKDEFVADSCCQVLSEGRVYLHLQDGRGWICERLRNDISRFGVEPCSGFTVDEGDVEDEVAEDEPAAAQNAAQAAAEAEAAKSAPRTFRSDAELWPEKGMGQPLSGATRVKLRRVFLFYGVKTRECDEDLQEVQSKIKTFSKASAAQKELQQYADQLRKEADKARKAWAAKVKETLAEAAAAEPEAEAADDVRSGVFPVQVQGRRWHCAMIREDDGGASKQLGPLRPTAGEAVEDLKRMRDFKVGGANEEEGQARKRQRTNGSG